MKTIELTIRGMHCASCVGRVEPALAGLGHVRGARVNLATEQAVVDIDDEAVKPEVLVQAVEHAGYQAELARLGLATPTAIMVGSGRGAELGILIKDATSLGLDVFLITGDNQRTAESVASSVSIGFDHMLAGVLPEAKAVKIRELQEAGRVVEMVGDGINDAPAGSGRLGHRAGHGH